MKVIMCLYRFIVCEYNVIVAWLHSCDLRRCNSDLLAPLFTTETLPMPNPKWKHLMNGSETGNWFDKNPGNINRKWQPRKGISLVNKELADAGYLPATKQDIEANYMQMLQLGQDDLHSMANNKDKPMLIRILAKNMLGWKWFDIIERMLDRGIGKATQRGELSWLEWWPLEHVIIKLPE